VFSVSCVTSDLGSFVVCAYDSLVDSVPVKLDIGPVYPAPAKDHNSFPKNFDPVQRELIFDIDMDDYDGVRTCCEGATVCHRCWRFMAAAVEVCDSFVCLVCMFVCVCVCVCVCG
jgi:DNA primase catalytic subunit